MIILRHLFLYSKLLLYFILVLRLSCSSSFYCVVYCYCITNQNPSSFVIVARNWSFCCRFRSWDRVRIPNGCCRSWDRVRIPDEAAVGTKAVLAIVAANGFFFFLCLLSVTVFPPSVPSANPAISRSNDAISPSISDNDFQVSPLVLFSSGLPPPDEERNLCPVL